MTENLSLQTTTGDQVGGFILMIRAVPVLMDVDLATLYGVTTKALNQAVQRNIERFPADFKFQLTQDEKNELVTNCDRLKFLVIKSLACKLEITICDLKFFKDYLNPILVLLSHLFLAAFSSRIFSIAS